MSKSPGGCPLIPVSIDASLQGLAMPPQTTYGTPCTGALTYHSVHGKNEENIKILRFPVRSFLHGTSKNFTQVFKCFSVYFLFQI